MGIFYVNLHFEWNLHNLSFYYYSKINWEFKFHINSYVLLLYSYLFHYSIWAHSNFELNHFYFRLLSFRNCRMKWYWTSNYLIYFNYFLFLLLIYLIILKFILFIPLNFVLFFYVYLIFLKKNLQLFLYFFLLFCFIMALVIYDQCFYILYYFIYAVLF